MRILESLLQSLLQALLQSVCSSWEFYWWDLLFIYFPLTVSVRIFLKLEFIAISQCPWSSSCDSDSLWFVNSRSEWFYIVFIFQLVMRHRQAQSKFAKRCTPVSLDDYSLDNISVYNSFRRKQRNRASKRSYTNAGFDDPVCEANKFIRFLNFLDCRY